MNKHTGPSEPQKADSRKTRSREALFTAFLDLLDQKPLNQIAIREIAATAGIGHATFYRHYATKEALLDDLAADEIRRLVDLALPVLHTVDNKAACLAQCEYIDARRTLWVTLLTGGAAAAVKEALLRISLELAAKTIKSDKELLPLELRVILIVSSIVETLSWWLRQKNPISVEKVACYLDSITSSE